MLYQCPGYVSGAWYVYRGRNKRPVFTLSAEFSLANELLVKEFVTMLNSTEIPGGKDV